MAVRGTIKNLDFRTELIAPCGMDCRLCMAYIRERNTCPGCRGVKPGDVKTRAGCKIKNCEQLTQGNFKHCCSCDSYPCERIKHIDKRYRTKYGMSMIENLENIKKYGVERFIQQEQEKWKCPQCGEVICVHYAQCQACGYAWR